MTLPTALNPLAVLLTLVAMAPWVSAQDLDNHAADRAALLKIKADYTQAVQTGQLDALEPHLAEGFAAVMVTGEQVRSFEALQDYWQHLRELIGPDGTYHVEAQNEPALISQNHAIARGTTQETVVASGRTYNFEARWTAVFIKQNDQWKILSLHASIDPIHNAFVRAALKQTLTWSLCGGLLAGMALISLPWWLVYRQTQRKRIPKTIGND